MNSYPKFVVGIENVATIPMSNASQNNLKSYCIGIFTELIVVNSNIFMSRGPNKINVQLRCLLTAMEDKIK